MSRQTPTSRRSPSILVTDSRHQKAHSAPFVSRRLNSVSVDSLLSNTSEVPSAQRRVLPRARGSHAYTSATTQHPHRSRMAGGRFEDLSIAGRSAVESSERTPLLSSRGSGLSSAEGSNDQRLSRDSTSTSTASHTSFSSSSSSSTSGGHIAMKPVPRLSKPLPSRQSKQSQRLVLIPDPADPETAQMPQSRGSPRTQPHSPPSHSSSSHSNNNASHEDSDTNRVTSYLISEGIILPKVAAFLKSRHRARVRLYGEALFADYLLPILPGDGIDFRIQSSVGDNRTMERLIDISEQGDHHFEYFTAESGTAEQDPSEPHDFSPRPGFARPDGSPRRGNSPVRGRTDSDSGNLNTSQSANYIINGDDENVNSTDDDNGINSNSSTSSSSTSSSNGGSSDSPSGGNSDSPSGGNSDSPSGGSTSSNGPNDCNNTSSNSILDAISGSTGVSNGSSTNSSSSAYDEFDNDDPHASSTSPRGDENGGRPESMNAASHEVPVHEQVETARRLQSYLSHAEIFVFNYGVVVFWNFTEAQEKQVLADLCIGHENLVVKPAGDQDIQSEELKFRYTQDPSVKPRVFNDLITLNNNSHMLKLAMSHAMAQSTILCSFEDRMQMHLTDVSGVPRRLALTGKLGMNREQLLKISGRLFKLRVDVNLSSNVLEVPDFFWDSEPSLFPLFNALREYLEIDQRVLVLNERQSVFLELTSILSDSIAEFNMDRITIIVIWLIVLSICVSLTEIAVRYINVSRKLQG